MLGLWEGDALPLPKGEKEMSCMVSFK